MAKDPRPAWSQTPAARRGKAASTGHACVVAVAFCWGVAATAPRCLNRRRRSGRTSWSNTGCPPLPPISGFVGRADGALLLNGITPYRATGTNLYYLQQLLSYAQQEQDPLALEAVREVMDNMVCLSLPVARIWGVKRFEGHLVDPPQPLGGVS